MTPIRCPYQILQQRCKLHSIQHHRLISPKQVNQQRQRQRQRQAHTLHVPPVAQPRCILVHHTSTQVLEDAPVDRAVHISRERLGGLFSERIVHLARRGFDIRLAEQVRLASEGLEKLVMGLEEEKTCWKEDRANW